MKTIYKGFFRPILTCIIICLVIVSCNDNFTIQDSTPSQDVDISSAKTWFKNEYAGKLGNSGDLSREIYWDEAYEYRNINDANKPNIVVVPIFHMKKGDYTGFKHLWIYKDKNGKMITKVVEYIRDLKEWKKAPKSIKFYTGVVLFRDWDNKFQIGFSIKDNKITGAVSEVNSGGGLEKANPATNPQARPNGMICNDFTVCQGWSIELLSFTVHGTNCYNDFLCTYTEYALDPAFTGITFDVPSGGASAWIIFDPNNINQPILPYGPPSGTRMGFSNNPCGGMIIMQQQEEIVNKEMVGYVTTDGKTFLMPYQGHDAHNCTFPGAIYSNGQIVFAVDYNIMTSHWDVTYYDWQSGTYGTSQTWELASIIHTHPEDPGYDNLHPSPEDIAAYSSFGGFVDFHIITGNRSIKFNQNGVVSNVHMPCLD